VNGQIEPLIRGASLKRKLVKDNIAENIKDLKSLKTEISSEQFSVELLQN